MSALGLLPMFWEVVGDSDSKTSSSIPSSIGFIVVDAFVRGFFSGERNTTLIVNVKGYVF